MGSTQSVFVTVAADFQKVAKEMYMIPLCNLNDDTEKKKFHFSYCSFENHALILQLPIDSLEGRF